MDKRVTIKDVAEAAGVCKATVSYILNNTKGQTISEKTKNKVWQVVNMLNYRPNAFAQNMRVNNEKRMIAIYMPKDMSIFEKLIYFDFLDELKKIFRENNYGIILLDSEIERISTADAILTCGLTRENFFELGSQNFIPLISIDCVVSDPLFFEISYDYKKLKVRADKHFLGDYTFVSSTPRDEQLRDSIKKIFPHSVFVDTPSELSCISDCNILVIESAFNEILSSSSELNILYPSELLANKAVQTVECIKLALSHQPYNQHIFKI